MKKKLIKFISREPESYWRQNYRAETLSKEQIPGLFLVRYSRPFLKWNRDELKQMVQRTRKLTTMNTAFNPRDDVGRLCVSRKKKKEEILSLKTALIHRYKS